MPFEKDLYSWLFHYIAGRNNFITEEVKRREEEKRLNIQIALKAYKTNKARYLHIGLRKRILQFFNQNLHLLYLQLQCQKWILALLGRK